jgi:hypothetical protein
MNKLPETNPSPKKPKNERMKIWRYMSLSKFCRMLITECLYFTRVDLLNEKFEGSWTEIGKKQWEEQTIALMMQYPHLAKLEQRKALDELTALFKNFGQLSCFVSCWHGNSEQSMAMWKLYGREEHSIVIQSTYELLEDQLALNSMPATFLGEITYDKPVDSHPISRLFYKREPFEYEREIRALINPLTMMPDQTNPRGLDIQVNLNELIQYCYVNPEAPKWVEDTVSDLIHKYGFKFKVLPSDLSKPPVF